jgi:hypothetical protein
VILNYNKLNFLSNARKPPALTTRAYLHNRMIEIRSWGFFRPSVIVVVS